MSDGIAGIVSFDVPHHGLVHKQWMSWPPPAHLAVARVHPPGREVAIAAVSAYDWVTDQAFIPHVSAAGVWIYDQVSITAEDPNHTPDGDPSTEPQLPAAYYKRRTTGLATTTTGGEHPDAS